MKTPSNKTNSAIKKQTVAIGFILDGFIIGSDENILARAVKSIEKNFPAVKITFSQLVRRDK